MGELTIKDLELSDIERAQELFVEALRHVADVQSEIEGGLRDSDAKVSLSIKIDFVRDGDGIRVVCGGKVALPSFRDEAITALHRGGKFRIIKAHQDNLPGLDRPVSIRSIVGDSD